MYCNMKMLNIPLQQNRLVLVFKRIYVASPAFGFVRHFVVTESMTFQKTSGHKMATDLRCVRQREFHSLVVVHCKLVCSWCTMKDQ